MLADLKAPEVEGGLLIVPVGAMEQHGPHLPLSTDTEIALALSQRVARLVPCAVVAAPVAYGASGEHEAFAGTISIGQQALEFLLVELGRSAAASFGRILLVSAHGGNAQPLRRAVERLRSESRDVRAWSPRWDGDAHAGRVETSIMLALRPESVELAVAAAGNTTPLQELLPALRSGGVIAVSRNGVLGDPDGASAAEGGRLLAAAENDLRLVVESW